MVNLIPTRSELFRRLPLLAAMLVLACTAGAAEQQPIDVLREHVNAGIAVLNSTSPAADGARDTQRDELCRIARGMFDIEAFARLTLAGNWKKFSAPQRSEFVSVFGDFLCRYYISRLQARYSNEQVRFLGQTFKSDSRAVVSASVRWQDFDVPIEIRMARRGGRWKAYDLVVGGISGVLIYRAQFEVALINASPSALIDELKRRIAEQG